MSTARSRTAYWWWAHSSPITTWRQSRTECDDAGGYPRVVRAATRRGELGRGDARQPRAHLVRPLPADRHHLGERRAGVRVEAETRGHAGEERRREADRVVRVLDPEHRSPEPRVRHEHQVPQRLDQRPLVLDTLVAARLGQRRGEVERRLPERLDHRPPGAQGCRVVAPEGRALGVEAVELGGDQRGDLDPVDPQAGDQPGHVGVDQDGLDHLGAAQVDVAEHGAGQVDPGEPGAAQLVGVGDLLRHGGHATPSPASASVGPDPGRPRDQDPDEDGAEPGGCRQPSGWSRLKLAPVGSVSAARRP